MREILFRGKRTDNGEWVVGSLICWDDGSCLIETGSLLEPQYAIDSDTVGQYTGLTDTNGKMIFERDICKGLFLHGLEVLSVVDFEGGAFGLRWNRGGVSVFSAFTSICNVSFEVIGNSYDNPELLKGEQP